MVPRFAAVAAGTHNRFTGAKGNWSISRQTNDLEATMAKSLQIRLKTGEVSPFLLLELAATNRGYIIPEWCTFVKIFLQKNSVFSKT